MGYFDIYGKLAERDLDDVRQNGRYAIQADAVAHILPDVRRKLVFEPTDTLLDIGCGMGNNLLPLCDEVDRAVGIDHPNVIDKLKRRDLPGNAELIGGDFMQVSLDRRFTKVMCYGVVPALPDEAALTALVMKVVDVTEPHGRALVSDFSNVDKKRRFLTSERGKAFQAEWQKLAAANPEDDVFAEFERFDTVTIEDAMVLRLVGAVRARGYHAYLVDQPQNLPFGNTREDLLIIGPEYADPA